MTLSSRELAHIEKAHAEGLSSRQILDAFASHGSPLSEATFRKYVQLGLLPRSRRVGEKGKHRGSRGIYPTEVVRRIDEIRRAMADGATLEQLAGTGQATRARLASVRMAMDELLEGALRDLDGRELERASSSKLAAALGASKKESEAWLRGVETWIANAERVLGHDRDPKRNERAPRVARKASRKKAKASGRPRR